MATISNLQQGTCIYRIALVGCISKKILCKPLNALAVTYKIPVTKNRMIGRKENDQAVAKRSPSATTYRALPPPSPHRQLRPPARGGQGVSVRLVAWAVFADRRRFVGSRASARQAAKTTRKVKARVRAQKWSLKARISAFNSKSTY